MNTITSKWLRMGAASIQTAVLAAAGLLLGAQPALAADAGQETVYDGCMQSLYGASLNCTANDVSIARASNIVITDECLYPGDTTTFTATFETMLNAQARHDIGIFFDTGGDPELDGAYTGTCSISSLNYKDDPPWLDLDGLSNPFVGKNKASKIQDTCGDIDAAHNPLTPTITVTAVCRDNDDDGFLDLPYCTSWRQPGANELCTGPLPEEFAGGFSSGVIPGAPSKCKCDAGFNVDVPVPPASLDVTKSAAPASFNEPGSSVQFTVTVKNAGVDPDNAVTLTSLLDDIYGDITTTGHNGITATTCEDAIGYLIQPGATYTCAFTATVTLDGGESETDTVTATGLDARKNTVEGNDNATVTAINVMPAVSIVKEANPTSVFEPGANVTFTVTITNGSVSSDPLTITSLSDNIYGQLAGDADCQVGTALASGANCSFQFTQYVAGNAGDSETDTVTVSGEDDEENEASASESATVDIKNVDSTIELIKTASQTMIDEPGANVVFTFKVTNTSLVDTVTIYTLLDDVYGDLDGQGTCEVTPPVSLAPNASYTCSATFYVAGEPGSVKNVGTASGLDDDGKAVSDSDDETVTIKDVPPSATLTKTVTMLCATYEVTVTNTSSAEDLELKSLSDDLYGDLDEAGNCEVPQSIAAGGTYTCSFEGCTTTSPTVDTVTGTVSDNDGGSVKPFDSAEVTFGKPVTK
jgi:hypothetical protein